MIPFLRYFKSFDCSSYQIFHKIPDCWKNPSNTYRLGVKHAYDLYPERLQERISEEYKDVWDREHKLAVADANRLLSKFENKHPRK